MDVVISCLDNRQARRAVNLACNRVGVPWVDGAIEALDGLVRVFCWSRQSETACYECSLTEQDYELLDLHYTCPPAAATNDGLTPTTPLAASIIGALEAQEAIKLLHDLDVRPGWVTYFSGQTLRTTDMQYAYKADCPAHQSYGAVVELETGTTQMTGAEMLRAAANLLGEACAPVLPRTIVTQLTCPRCRRVEELFRPELDRAQQGIACPDCGATFDFGRTNTISPGGKGHAASETTWYCATRDHALPRQARDHLIELTGDAAELVPGVVGQAE